MRALTEILLPTDFSPRSADVAHFAAGVARQFKSKVTLLHVFPPVNPAWAALGNPAVLDEVTKRLTDQTFDRLDRFSNGDLRQADIKRLVVEGDPATVITEYVAGGHVGLVMMATRGCAGFRRFLLGSVTAKVLHDVTCPVWSSSHIIDGHPTIAVIPKVIVCAADVTAEGEAVLQWASDLAADLQACLIVVHAIPSLEFHPETYFLEADMRRALIGDARTKLARWIGASRTPSAEIRVEGGNVSTVVRSVIEDNRADLLVIGRASGKGILGRLRTHSYALIRESPCPVISI